MKQCDMKIACDAIKKIDNLQDLNVVIRQLKLTQKTLSIQILLQLPVCLYFFCQHQELLKR